MYWINKTQDRSPFAELRSLQREMNHLFNEVEVESAISRYPALNLWGNHEKVVVRAELPGIQPDELDISVINNQLTIQGERKGDKPADEAVCHRNERETGKFVRTIRLPYAVQNEEAQAHYAEGVLTVQLPREEATKPKRIEIKAS